MRRRLAAFVLALAAQAGAEPPDLGTLRQYDAPDYSLIVADGINPGRIAAQIANFERVLSTTLSREIRPTGARTDIFVVEGDAWQRYLRPGDGIDAEFVPLRFSNLLLIDADVAPERLRTAIFHEYTHLFLHSQFRGLHPLWFDEGLATMMGNTKLGSRTALVRQPDLRYRGRWIPLARLFELDKASPEYLSADTAPDVHLQSWGLVHRGLVNDPAFGGSMLRFLEALNAFVPIEDAVQDSFGTSLAALDTTMQRYVSQPLFREAVIEFEPADAPKLGRGRKLGELETLTRIASAMLDTGFNAANVRELVDAAAALAPTAADVGVLQLRLALRAGDEATAARLLERGSGANPAVAREIGLALIEHLREPGAGLRAGADLARVERARVLLEGALEIRGDDAEAVWGHALAAARLGRDLDVALVRLERARTLVPDNADLAVAAALVHEAAGEPEKMLPALIEAYRHSGDATQRVWAAKRVRELRTLQRQTAPQ
jgi:tetratricopeptide (TPR) repeat protein